MRRKTIVAGVAAAAIAGGAFAVPALAASNTPTPAKASSSAPVTALTDTQQFIDQQAVIDHGKQLTELQLSGTDHQIGVGRLWLAECGTAGVTGRRDAGPGSRFRIVDESADVTALDQRKAPAGDSFVVRRAGTAPPVEQRVVDQ